MRNFVLACATCVLMAPSTANAACGGSFSGFVNGLKTEAVARGHDKAAVDRFFASVRQSQSVLRADRSQGVFQKPFLDFARNLISDARLKKGQQLGRQYDAMFDLIDRGTGSTVASSWRSGPSRRLMAPIRETSTPPTPSSRWRMTAAGLICSGHRYLPRSNSMRTVILTRPPPPALGQARSACCRNCRATSLKAGRTAMATGMSG